MTLRIIAAGGTFAGATLLGLLAGIWLAGHTGAQLWVLGGLFLGLGIGAFGAFRMLMSEIS
ncbi:MAG: hypothetical protein NVSMB31_08740 [Vulcanimicrobiaceae bacterium]